MPFVALHNQIKTYAGGGVYNTPTHSYSSVSGKQETVSKESGWIINKRAQRARRNKKFMLRPDLGTAFSTYKDWYNPISLYEGEIKSRSLFQGFPLNVWQGTMLPANPVWTDSTANTNASINLDSYGTTAIARTVPNKPAFDGAVYLAELLREGIPKAVGQSLVKSKFKDIRKVGNEYLNVQFGWVPLISGIKDLSDTVSKSEKILEQYRRDNGRHIRRKYSFKDETNVVTTVQTGMYPHAPLTQLTHYVSNVSYSLTRTVETTTSRWFSGCYSYHLEIPVNAETAFTRSFQEAKRLYGIRLTPDVIWNLAPWSWAVDWFSNAGDVISAISAFQQDGLVLRYGYIMETKVTKITEVMPNVRLSNGRTITLSHSYGRTRKTRRRATPYGFGLNWDGFSPYQMGIIGALGISKIPKGSFRP